MDNLLFFVAGFITFILVRYIYNSLILYLAFRKRKNMWVRSNYNNRIVYDKKWIK
jgi:hypothetical protein